MTKRRNRTYPNEFKLEILELFKSSGKSAAEIERELGYKNHLQTRGFSPLSISSRGLSFQTRPVISVCMLHHLKHSSGTGTRTSGRDLWFG